MAKKAFLGVGWKFPVDVDRRRGVAMSQYEDNIYESIIIIPGTALGERVMRPDFGCQIHDLIFAPNNPNTHGLIIYYVREAIVKWEPRVQPNEIGVTVKDGVVTLTGTVDSYSKRDAAEQAAHRVRGVKAVANDIEVRLFPTAERSDADIAAAAVRALEWDAFVPIEKLDVTVSKGWVTLRGEVEWNYQRADAYDVVRRLSGVKGVTNLIVVKPKVSLPNTTLTGWTRATSMMRAAASRAATIGTAISRGRAVHATVKADPASASSSVAHTRALRSRSAAPTASHSACGSG